jgi:hypothetical protein
MASRLGFERRDAGPTTILEGARGHYRATVEVTRRGEEGHLRFFQRIRIDTPSPAAPEAIAVSPPSDSRGVRLNEPIFDASAEVAGPEDAVVALFGPAVRTAIVGHGGHWTIGPSGLEWSARRAPTYLSATAEVLFDLARDFCEASADLPGALVARVEQDPVLGVRLRALQVLLQHGEDDRVRSTLSALLRDENPRIRLEAALALEAEGEDTLLELALGARVPARIRLAAAARVRFEGAAHARLWAMIESEDVERAVAGLELLGRHGTPADLARLEPVGRASSSRVRKAGARAREAILGRHPEVHAGSLALADAAPEPAGALSELDGAPDGDAPSDGAPR